MSAHCYEKALALKFWSEILCTYQKSEVKIQIMFEIILITKPHRSLTNNLLG